MKVVIYNKEMRDTATLMVEGVEYQEDITRISVGGCVRQLLGMFKEYFMRVDVINEEVIIRSEQLAVVEE